jgi:hypothetical protein
MLRNGIAASMSPGRQIEGGVNQNLHGLVDFGWNPPKLGRPLATPSINRAPPAYHQRAYL